MDSPVGTIQTIQETQGGRRLTVAVDVSVACPRCAAGKGCGAGIFGGRKRPQVVDALADPQMTLSVGDAVQLRLVESNLLNAAFIVYGVPLIGGLAGAVVAYGLQLGDPAAALASIVGLAAGALFGRRRLARPECFSRFVPQVEKRL